MSSDEVKTEVTVVNPDSPKVNPTLMIVKSLFKVLTRYSTVVGHDLKFG